MEQFIDHILQFGNLNKQQIALVESKATTLELREGDFYWEAGKTVNRIGFLTKGILRIYYFTQDGKEHTRYFIDENHLILDGPTPGGHYIPSEYLQAITTCEMVVFTQKDWKEISQIIVGWDGIVQKIVAKHHLEKLDRRSELVAQDATTRYRSFLEKFPSVAHRVPLSFIASYLGITQSSLSRIRKNSR
ncbi:Crp/Fnr family transcriptional regulator [Flavobacterium sp.]|uniref:Crp/Fnr family transcriptional regulator n=1 Tax=Flavobacterium sp. TaxID=239 RepID=UPI001227EE8F|nr:Crp/Fnr family transcriptional regulator [Flavobacterium sp.]RZJ69235.1 MAG: Crp/Fnr family transcriptional regulator [Flavobacterium sp.]